MHVLPLPFGLALALLPRRQAEELAKPKAARRTEPGAAVRDLGNPQTRHAAFRQVV